MPPANEPGASRRLVLTESARALRRQLGPTAWTVLEELLYDASHDEPMVVETHVRRIAAGVGISKDSVARALRRLIDDGIVDRRDGRQVATGCFGRSVYELHPEAMTGVSVLADFLVEVTPKQVSARRRVRRRASGIDGEQTTLFDDATGRAP